ncbi:MAG: inositol monophosphatase family protein [Myxococcota bacterium]|nr:inositol monophosphatase family protein [Myxococcota bacterium]
MGLDFDAIRAAAEAAADAARGETLSRFRRVGVETKADGSPVTEADKAAERRIRATLEAAFPEFAIRGEEYGGDDARDRPQWLVDPIDGTIGFSRGIPLFTTLISLLDEGKPVFGLIDCPALDERYVGWVGGGCLRNGEPTRVSDESDPAQAIVSHGDPFCFELWGAQPVFERMARECALLRGYTDAFGHTQVLGGGVAAMADLYCNAWDLAPIQVLAPEAGGRCAMLPERDGKLGVVFGNPALVETLLGWFDAA